MKAPRALLACLACSSLFASHAASGDVPAAKSPQVHAGPALTTSFAVTASEALKGRASTLARGAKVSQDALEAASRKSGLDASAMRADYAALASLKDLAARRAASAKLAEKYRPLLARSLEAAKVDTASERQRIKGSIVLDPAQRVLDGELASVWLIPPRPLPIAVLPAPGATTLPLGAPYAVRATEGGADANATTGRISALYDSAFVTVGSAWAQVGNPLAWGSRLTHGTVRGSLEVDYFFSGGVLGHSAGAVAALITVSDRAGHAVCARRYDVADVLISGAASVDRFEHATVAFECGFSRDAAAAAAEEQLTATVRVWAFSSTVGLGLLTAAIDGTPSGLSATLSP
jgi:hypothetical protein